MTGKPDFTISAAIHKAFVDVNETGTEAAAATAVVITAMARQAEPPPIVFRVDHPFFFLIRDTKSGSILFLGRVTDPTK
jgi:serpin B